MAARDVVAALNAAIAAGGDVAHLAAEQAAVHAGNKIQVADDAALGRLNAAAGVWVRQEDGLADGQRPWQPSARYADRWPTSILNHKHSGTWSRDQEGLIFRPELVRSRCGYAADGASQGQACSMQASGVGFQGGCVPGCTVDRHWCTIQADVCSAPHAHESSRTNAGT